MPCTGRVSLSLSLAESTITRRLKSAFRADRLCASDGWADRGHDAATGDLTCAAVLMPLVKRAGEWHLLFTHRTDTVEDHKDQVAFPGGTCDSHETAEQTAVREAGEEIGLRPEDVRILGRLTDQVTITSYRVSPVVGVIPWPYDFRSSPGEVSRVFTIPLSWLACRDHWVEKDLTPQGFSRPFCVVVYRPYDGEVLWGASARMTLEFLKVVDLL